jgi:hypothetical protein
MLTNMPPVWVACVVLVKITDWVRYGLLRHDRLSSILDPLRRVRKEATMWNIRKMVMTGAVIIAAGSAWHVRSVAQENAASGVGVATVFDRAKLDASFAKALANGGTAPLWSRVSSYGTSNVSAHSRDSSNSACPPQGCSHKGFTAVVIVVSGAATLEVGGTSNTTSRPD